MLRINFWSLLAFFACAWIFVVRCGAEEDRKPNVLFIALDDLRPELGCYGQSHIHSPNIDRLSARGVVFERAYCQFPVCNASRASILTGLRPNSTGVFNNGTHFRTKAPDVITLPEQFKNHGYHTQAYGKLFHGSFEKAYVGRAFDDPRSWSVGHWYGSPRYYFSPHGIEVARQVYANKFKKSGPELDAWTSEFVQGLATEAPVVEDNALYDGEMTDLVMRALSELKSKPFFLAVGYLKPHLPFVAPKKYWDLYDRASIRLPIPAAAPKNAPALALQNGSELRGQYTNMRGTEPLNDDQARELQHGYYACVSYVDAQIGRLLDELDRLGLRENTIVVLWGDHGWHLGEQGLWGKQSNFELATRVPLIIDAPGRKTAGIKNRSLVEFVDVYPSLCDLADLPLPSHLEGTSFVPLLDDPDRKGKAAAFSQVVRGKAMGRSMRTDRYRLTIWSQQTTPDEPFAVELYDYHQAPLEVENIASYPENARLLESLTLRLKAGWQAAIR
ncbi:MAG: sulfatase [Pirellulaceae bacterium]|nr:sulfatase [Pirellulaceae bacterium]